jgi:peroxiredoxin
MHYSFPQNMVDTVRALPDYKKLLETLRETGIDVVLIIEHLRVLFGLPHL